MAQFNIIICIPSQQSAATAQLAPGELKSMWQLLLPHVRVPLQSKSLSQSPPPRLHWFEDEQQLQSVDGKPLHCPVGGCTVVVANIQYAHLDDNV